LCCCVGMFGSCLHVLILLILHLWNSDSLELHFY
jgi:hypothetical protein